MRRALRLFGVAAAIAVAAVLSQCTAPTGTATPVASAGAASTATAPSIQASAASQAQNDADPSASSPSNPSTTGGGPADYRIGPRDSLQITVFQVPDLSSKGVLVDGQGDVVMPLIGAVHVAGLTTDEAGKRIAKKLGKTYLQNPQVFVVLQQSAKRIIVSGAVNKPTAIPPTGSLTLSQAVVAAGGLSDVANPDRVHIARVKGHRVSDSVYNLDSILAGKAPDPSVYGGDMIVAESSGSKVAFKNIKDLVPFTGLAAVLAGAF